MKLVIVESPAKAKTIEKFLGKDFKVIASKGHLRDLNPYRLSINVEDKNDHFYFTPTYIITKDHREIAKEIKDLAKQADTVYIASDDDREGEAIGWHIAHLIGVKDLSKLPRTVFHEITKTAILNAVKNPRTININKVNAQQTRRLLDRLVGYKLSPLLNNKIQRGLSAGRVQSAVLSLVVNKEEAIKKFVPVTYFTVEGLFKETDKALLVKYNNKTLSKMSLQNEDEVKGIVKTLKSKDFVVSNITKKVTKQRPLPPFTTSTLQQAASNHIGYGTAKTMQVAQKLYEGVKTPQGRMGVITYMRTDSVNIAKEAQASAIKHIEDTYGKEYVEPHIFTKKSTNAQEAHEAIRPTHIELTPEKLKGFLSNEEMRLYTLIYKRFLATQMKDSEATITTVELTNKETGSMFRLKGKIITFDGWRKVYTYLSDKDEFIKDYKEDEILKPNDVKYTRKQTEPPARYTEATLVKEMEKLGVGRPSTYASTINLLKNRRYVEVESKKLVPTENAFKIINVLREHFPDIVDVKFTAHMEDLLDKIANGEKDWQDVLSDFYKPFIKSIDRGYKEIKSQKVVEDTGEKCPQCGSRLVKRKGRYGDFVGCENYPKCKYIKPIKRKPEYVEGYKCPKCGGKITIKHYKGKKFYGCSNYPKCKYAANSLKKIEKDGGKLQ